MDILKSTWVLVFMSLFSVLMFACSTGSYETDYGLCVAVQCADVGWLGMERRDGLTRAHQGVVQVARLSLELAGSVDCRSQGCWRRR